MCYEMMFAESDKHVVSLDKCGNRYMVYVWSKKARADIESGTFETFDAAKECFEKRRLDYRCRDVQETHPEFCNID